MFGQIIAITAMNLRNIGSRLGTSSVIVVGTGGVVGVLIAILSLATGFREALDSAASPDRAIVMRGGTTSEMNGSVTRDQWNIIARMPGVVAASGEMYAVVDVPKKATGTDANMIIRGLSPAGFDIRPEVTVVDGRRLEPGRQELMVGSGARAIFAGVDVGDTVTIRGGQWTVVGEFAAEGGAYESELWGDFDTLAAAFGRNGIASTLRVQLDSPAAADPLAKLIADDPRLDHELRTEADYYASQSRAMTAIISGFGYAVTVIMAIGAVFAALNTMYSAVSSRTMEIATLRALGFPGLPVVVSILVEALLLAVLGALFGAGLVWLLVDGYTSSTLNNASFSQITFDYTVTGALVVQGLVWALALGLLGGLLPAVRAARLPITTALRGE